VAQFEPLILANSSILANSFGNKIEKHLKIFVEID
jgi:hypothetical protein